MNNVKMMGSLLDRLLSYVSSAPERDANYDIAVALLRNYSQLEGAGPQPDRRPVLYFQRIHFPLLSVSGHGQFQGVSVLDGTGFYHADRLFPPVLYYAPQQPRNCHQRLQGRSDRQYLHHHCPENAQVIPDIVKTLHDCGKAAYFSHHFLWDIGHYFQSKMMMMGRYVELFMDYATQLECARSLTERTLPSSASVGGSYLTRYPDICNAIPVQRVQDADHHPKPGQPYLNTADFILQCGTTNPQ